MHTKTLLAASLGAVAFGLAVPAAAQSDTPEFDGVYVGGSIGASFKGNTGETVVFDTDRNGEFGDTVRTTNPNVPNAFSPGFCRGEAVGATRAAGCVKDTTALEYYARVGADKQVGNLVFGVVGEFGRSELNDAVTAFSTTPANYVFDRELDWNAAVRARIGYAADRTLFYATGGAAYGRLASEFTSSNTANTFTLVEDGEAIEDSQVWGWQAGGGVEQKIGESFSIGVEYLYSRYDDDDSSVQVGPGTASPATNPFLLVNATGTDMARSDRFDFHAVRAVAAFRF